MNAPGRGIDPALAPIPFGREIGVELRKLVGTRATWTLVGIIAVLLGFVALIGASVRNSMTFDEILGPFGMVSRVFVGVLTIILVTGEWGQRTLLSTFTLQPRRERVIAAKACAAVLTALAVYLAYLVLAALVTAARGDSFGGAGAALRSSAIGTLFDVLMAFAMALAVLNTAGAIVAYLVLPDIVVPLLLSVIALAVDGDHFGDESGLQGQLLSWVYPRRVLAALDVTSPGATAWAQLLVCAVLWIGIPAMIGIYRVMRSDVK